MKWTLQILFLLLASGLCIAGGVNSSAVVDPFSEWAICTFSVPGEALGKVFPIAPSVGASSEEIQASIEKSSQAGRRFFAAQSIQLPHGTLMLASPQQDQLTVRTTVATQCLIAQFAEDFLVRGPTVLTCGVEAVESDAKFFQDCLKDVDHSRIRAALQDRVKSGKARVVASVDVQTPSGKHVAADSAVALMGGEQRLQCELDPILSSDREAVTSRIWVGLDPNGGEFTTETLVWVGHPRLVGLWPVSKEKWVAVFLTVRVVSPFAAPDPLLEKWLASEGESLSPTPVVVPPKEAAGMEIRRFPVPPDILTLGVGSGDARQLTMKQILIDQGISFPVGSDACVLPDSHELVARNWSKNLELVDAWVSSGGWEPPVVISLRLSAIETSAAVLRRLERDASPVTGQQQLWETLVKRVAIGEGSWVSCAWLEILSGREGKVSSGNQDPESGLSWTVGPVVGADGWSVDLESVLRIGGRQENELKSSLTTRSGSPQLLTIWASPGGHGDILQAVFVESRIVENLGRE
jgi:hypothetical protein